MNAWLRTATLASPILLGISPFSAEVPHATPAVRQALCLAPAPVTAPVAVASGALALALASVPDRQASLDALEEMLDRAREREDPLALRLDEEDESALADRTLSELWPRLTAADAWYQPHVGELGYRVTSCGAPDARYRLWRDAGDWHPLAPIELRHAAWAIVTVGVLEAPDAERIAAELRKRSGESTSTIALAIGPAEPGSVSELRAHARELERAAHRSARPSAPWLAVIAAADAPASKAPITPAEGLVFVVPRLGSIARPSDFRSEVERTVAGKATWVHAPDALAP